MKDVKLTRLIEAHLEGTLTPAEAKELSRILATSPQARGQFWEQAAVHGLIQEAARLEWLGTASQTLEDKVVRVSWWRWAAPLAAAAALAMLFAGNWWTQSPQKPQENGVAVLTRTVGEEWVDEQESLSKDAVLSPGTLRLKSGVLEIAFYSGARVTLEGPAVFRLISSKEGFLESGKITAHVPPEARGFKVGSGKVSLVDYGTDFGFAVADTAPEEVHVFNGRVDVATPGGAPRSLIGGEAVRVQTGVMQSIEANRAAFLTDTELDQRDEELTQQRFASWKEASAELGADPAGLIYYNFEPQNPAARLLRNRANASRGGTPGEIIGCGWTAGRWPDKHGLDFRGEGQRVRFTIPQTMQQVTLLAWVRVDSLTPGIHSLVSADTYRPGALRWGVSERGQIRLGIARHLHPGKIDWEVVESAPIITPQRFGQWMMITTTFDGKTVRHYCNGRPVGNLNAYSPGSLYFGAADIGNAQTKDLRNFLGSMDELALLSRTMSPDEVHRYYELSRP